jgi:hypothetical protein
MTSNRRILVLLIGLPFFIFCIFPLIPLPFNGWLWKHNIFRRNLSWSVDQNHLKDLTRAEVIIMLGEPGDVDKQGIEYDLYSKSGVLYYFIPVWWKNCALIVRFDAKNRATSSEIVTAQ